MWRVPGSFGPAPGKRNERDRADVPLDLEVLTVGRISIDLYCGQLGDGWHAATSFSKAVGGSPTNVAIAAARS
jgi:hypothetical protein